MSFDKPAANKLLPIYEIQLNNITHEMTNRMSEALDCLNDLGAGAKLFKIQGSYKVQLPTNHLRIV